MVLVAMGAAGVNPADIKVRGASYGFEDCARAVALVETGHATGRTVTNHRRATGL